MKLTRYQKDAIIRAILNDLPRVDETKLVAEIKAALYKSMSPECKRLHNKTPGILLSKTLGRVGLYGKEVQVGDADFDAVIAHFVADKKAREQLESDVRGAITGCSTRKQLIDRYPEFSKYAPSESGVCKTLPAPTNVIADLVKAGWKQTVFKQAAK